MKKLYVTFCNNDNNDDNDDMRFVKTSRNIFSH